MEIFCGNVPRGTSLGDLNCKSGTDAENAGVRRGRRGRYCSTWNVGGFLLVLDRPVSDAPHDNARCACVDHGHP